MSARSPQPSVLIVDDSPREIEPLREALRPICEVRLVTDADAVLESVRSEPPDLILLDTDIGGTDGLAVCNTLKEQEPLADIPILFLAADLSAEEEARGLSLGAVDFLHKPFRLPIVAARIRNHLQRVRDRNQLLKQRAVLDTVMDMSGIMVVATDEKGTIFQVNRTFEHFSGITPEKIINRPVWQVLAPLGGSPDQWPVFTKRITDIFRAPPGTESTFEWKCRDNRNTSRRVAWKVAHIAAENGSPPFAILTGTDISHRLEEAEKADRATQSRIAIAALLETSLEPLTLKRQLEIALDIILFIPWLAVEFKGAIFLMNQEAGLLEMIAHRDLPKPLLTQCARIAMGQCLCGQAGQSRQLVFENRVRENHTIRFDGMTDHGHYCVPILFRDQLLGVLDLYLPFDHQRQPEEEALLSTVANTLAGIIQHRRLEGALHSEREFVSTVLGTTSALVTVLDDKGRIVLFNNACEALSGYRAAEMEGHPYLWDKLLLPEEMPAVEEHIHQLTTGLSPARHEHHWLTRGGVKRLISWVSTTLLNADESVKNIIATGIDITSQREAEKKLTFLAHNDTLTGLPNRRLFLEYLNQALAQARRHRFRLVVLFMDLDKFKAVNDTLGHDIGDLLLREAAHRIQHTLRETDIVARLGGDEFTVLLGSNADTTVAKRIADKIITTLCQPFTLQGHTCEIGTSIGISCYPKHGTTADMLLKKADTAMYAVKKRGRNHCLVFDPEMETLAVETGP